MSYSLSVNCGRSVVYIGLPVSSTNKTECHDITEILFIVVSNTIKSLKIQKGNQNSHIEEEQTKQNGQKKRYKRTTNDLQNIHIKLKIE